MNMPAFVYMGVKQPVSFQGGRDSFICYMEKSIGFSFIFTD